MKRIYAEETMYKIKDENLHQYLKDIYQIKNNKEIHDQLLKEVCNVIRNELGIDKLISFGISKVDKEVSIYVFDMPADDKVYSVPKLDKEKKLLYIEIED